MDRDAFDGLTKLLGASPSRRAALGALLGGGLASALDAAEARKGRKRRSGKRDRAQVSAQAADCASPGPSTNISGCGYQNDDFSGDDLSGSKMVGTNFRNANLSGANLSSSNAKNAIFREATLTCANLRSSTLGGADFRDADLTKATLKSSADCNSATFNAATTFCGTVMCDGSIRNDNCPGGPPAVDCCTADDACPNNQVCAAGLCGCPAGWTAESGGWCAFRCTTGPNDNCGGGDCACRVDPVTRVPTCTTPPAVGFCSAPEGCPDGSACGGSQCFRFCGPATD